MRYVTFIFLAVFLFLGLTTKVWASASLTMSGPSVDSTGKILTIPITGVSGSLSPASGITGFTVTITSMSPTVQVKQVSVTSSGSTVTLTMDTSVFSGETVVVTLATSASSNLTDG